MRDNIGFTPSNHFEILKLSLTDRYGDEWDLKDFLIEMNVFHSMFQLTSTANIILGDPNNMRFNRAIFGGEIIQIVFKNAGMDKNQTLKYCVKSHGEQVSVNNTVAIKYQLITEEAFADISKRVSVPHDGNYPMLVKKMLEVLGSNKPYEWGDSLSSRYLTAIPYSSPMSVIKWSAYRCYGIDKTPFLFFEDLDGYKFKPVGELLVQESEGEFFYEPLGLTDDDGLRQLFTIRKLEVNRDSFNSHELAQSKPNRNQFFLDITNKAVERIDTRRESLFDIIPSLEKNPIPQPNSEEVVTLWSSVLPDNSHRYEVVRDYYKAILRQFGFKFVTLAGDHIRVGAVYDFNPLSNEVTIDGKKYPDDVIRGRYLLVNIKRTFTTKSYTTTCEIVKESLYKEV